MEIIKSVQMTEDELADFMKFRKDKLTKQIDTNLCNIEYAIDEARHYFVDGDGPQAVKNRLEYIGQLQVETIRLLDEYKRV